MTKNKLKNRMTELVSVLMLLIVIGGVTPLFSGTLDSASLIHPKRSANDQNQEEIIILDESKIDVANARYFTIGDIDDDGISEVITFKSIKENSSFQWIMNTYHKDTEIWVPILSKIFTDDVSGFIHKVDIGNFE